MRNHTLIGSLTIALLGISGLPLEAQQRTIWPGSPQQRGEAGTGLPVSPFFEGWYENPDGTYTFSFGFHNRNRDETVLLPVGEENTIEPAEYNGRQPTVFTPRRGTGVFTVTVPGDFARDRGRVVWTLRTGGETHSVPGWSVSETYRLGYLPMGMGSYPPVLKLEEDGPELWGPMSFPGDPRTDSRDPTATGSIENPVQRSAGVGQPLSLAVWVADRLDPEGERDPVDAGVTWFTHQGPAVVEFEESEPEPDGDGRATTTARFPLPGEYLLRVRSDNFNPVDSSLGDQCCWTNGYVRVQVSP